MAERYVGPWADYPTSAVTNALNEVNVNPLEYVECTYRRVSEASADRPRSTAPHRDQRDVLPSPGSVPVDAAAPLCVTKLARTRRRIWSPASPGSAAPRFDFWRVG